MNDYRKIIRVNKPVSEVYEAITEQIADWWSTDLSGAAAHVGDSFNIAFGGTRKTMDISEAVPNELVIWTCAKAYIDMPTLKNKTEWEGSRMIWTLTGASDGTELNFLHEGLNRNMECFDICEDGWNYFLNSLEAYLKTGEGTPYIKALAKEV